MTVPVDMSKLSNVVKNDVVKKVVYEILVTKVNNIGTNGFFLKTRYEADKSELEKTIPNTSRLVKNTGYNFKISGTESKISSISDLTTTSALTAVENKIPNATSLVKNSL